MKRVQNLFLAFKEKNGRPPNSVGELHRFMREMGIMHLLGDEEREYAKKLLKGIRQRKSRGNLISPVEKQKIVTLLNDENFGKVVKGLRLLEKHAQTPQDVYDVLNHGKTIRDTNDFNIGFSYKSKGYISVFIAGLLANLGDSWALGLKKLDMRFYGMKIVPDNIGNLINLEYLDLANNRLTSLPNSIGNLTNLKELIVNSLTSLPDSIGNLTNLIKVLNLEGSDLTSLPDSIGNLTNLEKLDLHSSDLTSLPDSIGNLTNLTELRLSKNQLTSLPKSFGNLTNLEYLDLNWNYFTSVPDSIENLTDLETLYVPNNPITSLPNWVENRPYLEVFWGKILPS